MGDEKEGRRENPNGGMVERSQPTADPSGYRHELQKLRGRHHQIIRLAATGQYNGKEIADIIGCTPQTVYNTLNSELAQQKMRYLQREADGTTIDILDSMQELAPLAVAHIEEALLSGEDLKRKEQIRVAQDLLDRTGFGKTSNLNVRQQKVTDEDIREIRAEARRKKAQRSDRHKGEDIEDAKLIEENGEPSDQEKGS